MTILKNNFWNKFHIYLMIEFRRSLIPEFFEKCCLDEYVLTNNEV